MQVPVSNQSLRISNARIFDGHDDVAGYHSLVFSGGVITAIDDDEIVVDREIDAAGARVTPGLIDAHFHAYGVDMEAGAEPLPMSFVALAGAARLAGALQRGFTTVRDPAGGDVGLAVAVSRGMIASPRYFYTGAALSQTGGHGDERSAGDTRAACAGHSTEVVDGADAVRIAVRERFRGGAHAIKIMTSGGVISPTDPIRQPQYSLDEIRAATEEAARRSSYVAAHAYSPEAIQHSLAGGVRSIEHGNLLDAATATLMAEHGAYLVATPGAYEAMARLGPALGLSDLALAKNAEVAAAGQVAIRLAHEAGVCVGFGSDNMGALVSEQAVGIRLLAEASSNLAALRSATSVNAALLQQPQLGSISIGNVADVVIWEDDPLEDIDAVADQTRGRTVIQAGRVISDVIRG